MFTVARPELIFEFVARYQLDVIEPREIGADERVFAFPVAPAPRDAEIPAGVTVRVVPPDGAPWVGVFPPGEYGRGPHRPTIIGWPDEVSFGVVHKGAASFVRADDPLVMTPSLRVSGSPDSLSFGSTSSCSSRTSSISSRMDAKVSHIELTAWRQIT
jgi:hypothetical protein